MKKIRSVLESVFCETGRIFSRNSNIVSPICDRLWEINEIYAEWMGEGWMRRTFDCIVRDLALRAFLYSARTRHREESGERCGTFSKRNSNIYYNFPVLAYVFPTERLKNGASAGNAVFLRRIISAQFRRFVYIIRVRRGSRPYKSSCLFLCILAMAISFLEHAEIVV